MMRQRILMISSSLEQRGSSHYTLNLARELISNGRDVQVLTSGGGMVETFIRQGVNAQVYSHLGRPAFAPIQMKRLEGAVSQFQPDVIHLQSRSVLSAGSWFARFPKPRIVLTVHSKAKERSQQVARLRRLDGIIATNEPVREDLVNVEKVSKELIQTIPAGVDTGRIDGRSTRPLFANPVRLVGTIGPVESERGQALFIKAIPPVIEQFPDAHFVVAGEGPSLRELRRLAASLSLERHLTFVTDFARYEDIIETLDLVVYTSLEDVSAFSLLEAMAWGRPVISFGTPAVGSIVEHGRTGLLVNRGDVQGLCRAIVKLLTDEDRAHALAEAARGAIREYYDTAVVGKKVMKFYDTLR